MPNLIIDLMVDRVDLVDEGANSEAFIKLYKRKETEPIMTFEEILAKMKPEHAKVIEEAVAKAKTDAEAESNEKVKDAETKMEDAQEELKKAKAALEEVNVQKNKDNEPDFEEVIKGLDPAVQDVFKSLKAQKDAAEEVARQAGEKAANEEAIAKAKDLKALPVDEAKLVEVVKGVSPEIFEILKAASAAIEGGDLFTEVGKAKDDNAGSDAWSKIDKRAEAIAKEQSITKQKATLQAIKENPELYKEYLEGGAN